MSPEDYDAWYHTPRGAWIAGREMALMRRLLGPAPGASLLDVGCGTGHFTRRFAQAGLGVTGLDPDPAMLDFAHRRSPGLPLIRGTATSLPIADGAFDLVTAVTSLCFVKDPRAALAEMWRVARRGVLVGLLNPNSLLHRRKAGKGGYAGARWDAPGEARRWAQVLRPPPAGSDWGTAVLLPGGGAPARALEACLPHRLPWGAFLGVYWAKPEDPGPER